MNIFRVLNKETTLEESSEVTCPQEPGSGAPLPVSGDIRFKSHMADEKTEFSRFISQKSTQPISQTKEIIFSLHSSSVTLSLFL